MFARALAATAALPLALAGCVAPETPPPRAPASVSRPVSPPTAASGGAAFEDAPIPNRGAKPPTGNSLIQIQH